MWSFVSEEDVPMLLSKVTSTFEMGGSGQRKASKKMPSLMVGQLHIAEWNGISCSSLIYFLMAGKSFESNLSHSFIASAWIQCF